MQLAMRKLTPSSTILYKLVLNHLGQRDQFLEYADGFHLRSFQYKKSVHYVADLDYNLQALSTKLFPELYNIITFLSKNEKGFGLLVLLLFKVSNLLDSP